MNETYHQCLSSISSRFGWPEKDESSLIKFQNFCSNLSKIAIKSRQLQNVLDLEKTEPVDLAKPLYGYAAPVIIFITFVLNIILTRNILTKRLRSPTNIILAAVAVADTLTGLATLPHFIYIYALEGYKSYPSVLWCHVFHYGTVIVPVVLHTTSLWLTVLLSLQRYSGISNKQCLTCITGYKGVSMTIAGIVLFSCVLHSFLLLVYVQPIKVVGKRFFDQSSIAIVNTCSLRLRIGVSLDSFNYVYTWIKLALAEVLPCVLLTFFNILLVRVTYSSFNYRRRLVIGNKHLQNAELWPTIRTSAMLLLIAFRILLVESFYAANLLITFVQQYHKSDLVPKDVLGACSVVSNFLVIATCPFNFLFCVCLSSSFRDRLSRSLKPGRRRKITPRQLEVAQQETRESVQQISLISVLRYSEQSN